jgi:hypothetical protein
MFQLKVLIGLLLMAVSAAPVAKAAPIDDLIAAAKKEGTVEFFAAGTLGAEGAQKLGEAFNKKYRLNLKKFTTPPPVWRGISAKSSV